MTRFLYVESYEKLQKLVGKAMNLGFEEMAWEPDIEAWENGWPYTIKRGNEEVVIYIKGA